MGLSMAHGIIHQHGGHILLESEVDRGTIIKILLPQVSENETKLQIKHDSQGIATGSEDAGKHILIVDDELSITIYLSELLQNYGYKVTAFNNSEDALSYFEEHHEEFDLILTDQTMPGISGLDMATKMISIANGIPVILCTGYSDQVDEKKALENSISVYMDKPIQSDELIYAIRSLLV